MEEFNMKFYLVFRPSLMGTTLPAFYYTFAKDEKEARHKVEMAYGEFDDRTQVREITGEKLNMLVIGSNSY